MQNNKVWLLISIFSLIMMMCVLGLYSVRRKAFNNAIQAGYEVYIDGVKVSAEHIDTSLYDEFTIDEDDRKVYVAK